MPDPISSDLLANVLNYGVGALFALLLLGFIYRLFLKMVGTLEETSKVISAVTRALDNNTAVIEGLKGTVNALERDTVVLREVLKSVDNNTKAIGDLQQFVSRMGQSVEALCTLVEMEAKRK